MSSDPTVRTLLAVMVTVVGACAFLSAADPRNEKDTLQWSCLDQPFLSVSASAPGRDHLPSVELTLIDPHGRTAGAGPSAGKQIPRSRVAEVVEIPGQPQRSTVAAVEVCNAEQGIYTVTMREHGAKPYRIVVRIDAQTSFVADLILHHASVEGRVRSYKFIFRVDGHTLTADWLDDEGRPDLKIEDGEW